MKTKMQVVQLETKELSRCLPFKHHRTLVITQVSAQVTLMIIQAELGLSGFKFKRSGRLMTAGGGEKRERQTDIQTDSGKCLVLGESDSINTGRLSYQGPLFFFSHQSPPPPLASFSFILFLFALFPVPAAVLQLCTTYYQVCAGQFFPCTQEPGLLLVHSTVTQVLKLQWL